MAFPVKPGDVVDGSYVIERLLGEGGMGAVFIAREERLGRRVAIKVLHSAAANKPDAVARFEREARSAAVLQSDHVTRVLSVGRLASGAPYIVMELLEGEDLAATLASRGPLPAHEVAGFMTQVCEALAEAHALGIVHRDLKPANVFLSRRASGGTRVKVLDFGISKGATGSGAPSLTATTAFMGTPLYMSPEQLREARNVDGRADLWALGAMMYELLSGKPPFLSTTLTELCVLIMTKPHAPLIGRRPDVGPALDAIVSRCLQKNPADRFATAQDLMQALAALPGPGVSPAVPPPPQTPRSATEKLNPVAALRTEWLAVPARVEARPNANAQTQAVSPSRPQLPAVTAATVDPVSTTQAWVPPKRPNALGLALVFVVALAIGGVAFYALVLAPAASEHGDARATASGSSTSGAASAFAANGTPSASSGPTASASAAAEVVPAPGSSASAKRPAIPTVAQATPPTPPPPAVVILPPPVTLPAPAAVPSPTVIVTPAPSARVVPSAKPTATPPSSPSSLMPAVRN